MYPEHLLLDRKKAGARGWVKNASVPCPSQAVPTGHWETAGVPAGWEVECHGETPPNAESFCFFFPLILSFFKKKNVSHRQQRKEQHKNLYGKSPSPFRSGAHKTRSSLRGRQCPGVFHSCPSWIFLLLYSPGAF